MRSKVKKTLITSGIVLGLLLLVIGLIVILRAMGNTQPQVEDVSSSEEVVKDEPEQTEGRDTVDTIPSSNTDEAKPVFNPDTTATIVIEPLAITVYYTKGVGALSYQVLRTPSGTHYVEFQAESLVGTKCTNDRGVFASILENPTADEVATLTRTTTVDGKTYGLSLTDDSCTSSPEALKSYQSAFSEGFDLLSRVE